MENQFTEFLKIKEEKIDEINNNEPEQASTLKADKKPSFDLAITSYLIKNFGERFYNSNTSDREEVVSSILDKLGSGYSKDEIKLKFHNLRMTYNKKRKELETGKSSSIKWQPYQDLDKILSHLKPRSRISNKRKVDADQKTEVLTPETSIGSEVMENQLQENSLTKRQKTNDEASPPPPDHFPILSTSPFSSNPPKAHSNFHAYNANPYNFAHISSGSHHGTSFDNVSHETSSLRQQNSTFNPANSVYELMNQLVEIQHQQTEIDRQRTLLNQRRLELDNRAHQMNSMLFSVLFKTMEALLSGGIQ